MFNLYNDHKHHVMNMVMVVVFIVFFGIGMYLLSQKGNTSMIKPSAGVTPTKEEIMPISSTSLMLSVRGGKTSVKMGEQVVLVIKGNSNGQDINGFDSLIGYDPAKLEFVSAESANKQFQLFTFKNPSYVSLTAAKLLSVNSPAVFANDDLVMVTMKAKAMGSTSVEILPSQGREKSKMVDSKAHIMIPSVNSVQLEIK